MEFADAVRKRHMVRRYLAQPVDPQTLNRILDAAPRGPSAGFAQGVEFVVVQSDAGRRAIAAAAGEAAYVARGFEPWLSAAPVHVVVAVDPARYVDRYAEADKASSVPVAEWTTPYWFVDGGAALMLVMLAATDEGLGAGFLGSHAFGDLKALVGLPERFEAIGVVTLGHAMAGPTDGSARRPRRDRAHVIHHENWSG